MSKENKTKEEVLRKNVPTITFDKLIGTPISQVLSAMDEYAEIKSRERAIEMLKWGASNRLEFLLGVWCDNERTYDSPEEIFQTFIQQTEKSHE